MRFNTVSDASETRPYRVLNAIPLGSERHGEGSKRNRCGSDLGEGRRERDGRCSSRLRKVATRGEGGRVQARLERER